MSTAVEYDRLELEQTRSRLSKMVALETRGFGDDVNALRRLCQKYRLPFWTVERIRQNKVKKASGGVIRAVKEAYISLCEQQIKALQNEIAKDKAKYPHADYGNLEAEAVALAEKVKARRLELETKGI